MSYNQIKEEINGLISQFWSAKNSQIKPELRKLLKDRAISYDQSLSIYQLTDSGRQDFMNWIMCDEACDPIEKDAFCMRVLFSDKMQNQHTRQLLVSQIAQHKAKLKYLEMALPSLIQNTDAIGARLIQKRILSKEQAYIDWLEECLCYFQNQSQ